MVSSLQIRYGSIIPLVNLLAAMLLGLLLRFIPLQDVKGVNYKFFLHAHSHVAFLGWVYMALFILILKTFFNCTSSQIKQYSIQFWLSQLSVIGMLIFFPIQGYALYSIVFSTIHIFVSYWFSYSVLKELKSRREIGGKFNVSLKFLKASLFFLVVSSVGPFALGIIMSQGLSAHPIYNLSIYFYLHFQYNGWFSFAVIGLLISLYESRGLIKNVKGLNLFFRLMFWTCIPGYLLSTLYLDPSVWVYVIGFVSAALQVIALVYLKKAIPLSGFFAEKEKVLKFLFGLAFVCLLIKTALQFFSVFMPIFQVRNFIIGYLHLTLIGFISFSLIGLFVYHNWLFINKIFKISITLIFFGFISSELVIFGQGVLSWIGIPFPFYYSSLFFFSLCMPVGIILLMISRRITEDL